jgi:hypothetical protein
MFWRDAAMNQLRRPNKVCRGTKQENCAALSQTNASGLRRQKLQFLVPMVHKSIEANVLIRRSFGSGSA